MTRIFHVLAAVLLLLVAGSCRIHRHHETAVSVVPPALQDSTAGIRQLLDEVMAADEAADLERAVACYSDDALLLPPGRTAMSGRDAIRAHYRGAFDDFRMHPTCHVDEIRVAGGWAVVRGTVGGTIVQRSDDAVQALHDKFMAIVERDSSGRWRLARLIWNADPPA
jgi:uncharacterized protein (TIGR02246 family)